MRHGPWKYLYYFEDEREELYYLPVDEGENHNLMATRPEVCSACDLNFVPGGKRSMRPCPRNVLKGPRPSDQWPLPVIHAFFAKTVEEFP